MHRRKKIPLSFFVVFVAAFALAFAAVRLAPIPAQYQSLSFFVLFPALSFAGIWIVSKIKKK